jgi:hypothetical protein
VNELSDVIDQVRRKIARYGKNGVNEQNTKATLIQPLLRALGWDVEDLDDVHLEYRQKGKDKPVDYALLLLRSPCLFLEAKSLGESLDDRKWANQVMGYASVAGVQWVVLTDGDEYRIYNSHATVPVEEKLFRKVRISDESTPPEGTLWLLSKEQMQERQINRLWDAHFVDRQVKAALRQLIASDHEPDSAFVRFMAKRLPTLTAGEIRSGLRRLDVQIACPLTDELPPLPSVPDNKIADRKKKTKQTQIRPRARDKSHASISLASLLESGLISSPLQLFRKYKGQRLEATLRENGTIEFRGQQYNSCSAAARGAVIGGMPPTNGWTFWQYRTPDGKVVQLNQPRERFSSRDPG